MNHEVINKRIQMIGHYKTGELGTLWFEDIDPENGRPYFIVKVDSKSKPEVIWTEEFKEIAD